eukprot:1161746-Pelagomonas_calceolata.AAC.1
MGPTGMGSSKMSNRACCSRGAVVHRGECGPARSWSRCGPGCSWGGPCGGSWQSPGSRSSGCVVVHRSRPWGTACGRHGPTGSRGALLWTWACSLRGLRRPRCQRCLGCWRLQCLCSKTMRVRVDVNVRTVGVAAWAESARLHLYSKVAEMHVRGNAEVCAHGDRCMGRAAWAAWAACGALCAAYSVGGCTCKRRSSVARLACACMCVRVLPALLAVPSVLAGVLQAASAQQGCACTARLHVRVSHECGGVSRDRCVGCVDCAAFGAFGVMHALYAHIVLKLHLSKEI